MPTRRIRLALLATAPLIAVPLGPVATAAQADVVTVRFAPHVYLPAPERAMAVAVGDLDNDGSADLVATDAAGSGVGTSVLLGEGGGSFAPVTRHAGGGDYDLALSDLDGDGNLDVVGSNFGDTNVSVLLGDGAGDLGVATEFPTDGGPVAVAVADLNGDQHPDVITGNYDATVSVLLGDGSGGLGVHQDFATGALVRGITVVDLDGDGSLDVLTGNQVAGSISVLLGNGAGGFANPVSYTGFSSPHSVATGDFDGDQDPDVVVNNAGLDTVSVLLGTGAGEFVARSDFATDTGPFSVAISDLDADGRRDLVTANQWSGLSVLRNTGPADPPGSPTIGPVQPGNAQATVSWTAPEADGGAPISGYVVTPYLDGVAQAPVTFDASATTRTVTGLDNGSPYRFAVAATNLAGTGPASGLSAEVTPLDQPTITPGAVPVVLEGDTGSQLYELPVSLSEPSSSTVSVHWATVDTHSDPRVAQAGTDFVAASGTVTFPPGSTTATVPVEVLGDTVDEPPLLVGEWGLVLFSDPVGAFLDTMSFYGFGVVVIVDDDDPPPAIVPGVVLVDAEGDDGSTTWGLPVRLSHASRLTVSVEWTTVETTGSGQAEAGTDFVAASGTVTFPPGATTATVPIQILGDTLVEPPLLWGEWGLVAFADPIHATLDTTTFYGHGIFVIVDDDGT